PRACARGVVRREGSKASFLSNSMSIPHRGGVCVGRWPSTRVTHTLLVRAHARAWKESVRVINKHTLQFGELGGKRRHISYALIISSARGPLRRYLPIFPNASATRARLAGPAESLEAVRPLQNLTRPRFILPFVDLGMFFPAMPLLSP